MTAHRSPPDPEAAAEVLRQEIRAHPSATLIALDVDGTLAAITLHPDATRVLPGTAEALRHLAARGVRVAIVTGRPAPDAVRLVGLRDTDPVTVLGHYGMQRWYAGSLTSPPVAPGVAEARAALPDLLADAPAGVHVEDKEHSLVVHTRPTRDPAATLEALRPRLAALAERTGLELMPGRAVVELRPPGVDKGEALRSLVGDARTVVYVGDDVADLAAFAVLRELAGRGVTTLAVASADPAHRDQDPGVAAAADLTLPGPAAVVGWLTGLAG